MGICPTGFFCPKFLNELTECIMQFDIQKIDTQNLSRTSELSCDDECYFLGDYVSGNYQHDMTSFILDFKSKPDHFRYGNKNRAMQQLAKFLASSNIDNYTVVPVPPSKSKSNPDYDDRLIRTLEYVGAMKGAPLDVQELILQNQSYEASHDCYRLRKNRPDSSELITRYSLQNVPSSELKDTIMIFDDVITKGSHFKAIQRLLAARYPEKKIIGLFIAQTYFYNR